MPAIAFRSDVQDASFLDPRRAYARTVERLQVRYDPLTGRTTHLAHFDAVAPQSLDFATYRDPAVKGYCPFCAEHREQDTPRFPPELIREGRWERGEAILVPNLFPYEAHGAVVVMTREHVVPLADLAGSVLRDALELGIEYLRHTVELVSESPCPIMAWNYMPPSGGGLVHPHQQYFVTHHPGNLYRDELAESRAFACAQGCEFWAELVAEEKRRGERYVGAIGEAHWLAAFAPLGILGEIVGVLPAVRGLEGLTAVQLADLADGMERVLAYFGVVGIHSFNASLFLPPAGTAAFAAHLRLVPRTFLNLRDHAPDLNFFQALLQEPVSVVLPEELCRDLRAHFG